MKITGELPTSGRERIYLRILGEADIDERFVSWFRQSERLKYYSGSKRVFTRETLVQDLCRGRESGSHFIYGVFAKEVDVCIGTVKVGQIVQEHKISDLVTFIGDHDYFGKGYGAEAIRVGTKLAFEKYDLRKLTGGMFADNTASIQAYTSAGWVIEGRLKGHYWVDGKPMDRVLVSCFNAKYFGAS